MIEKSLITYSNFSTDKLNELIEMARFFNDKKELLKTALLGKIIGILFTKTSTRTRTSFWSAALKLGAQVINFSPNDLQLKTGENFRDTGKVLGEYLDALVIRTNGPLREMEELNYGLPVINAMSECEHPTQILGDFIAMQEHFKRDHSFEIAYFGEGNNTASAMAYFFSNLQNIKINFYMPHNYSLSDEVVSFAKKSALKSGASIKIFHEIPDNPEKVDVIYTTRWETMGVNHEDPHWKDIFHPFRVDKTLFEKFSKGNQSVFMHDLPAVRGDEVTEEILDGQQSIAFQQAYHKLTGAAGSLLWLLYQQ